MRARWTPNTALIGCRASDIVPGVERDGGGRPTIIGERSQVEGRGVHLGKTWAAGVVVAQIVRAGGASIPEQLPPVGLSVIRLF